MAILGALVSWVQCHVRAVPASKLEWAAEHWALSRWDSLDLGQSGEADTESSGPGSPSSGHGLRQLWGDEENIPTRPRVESSSFLEIPHCGVASIWPRPRGGRLNKDLKTY